MFHRRRSLPLTSQRRKISSNISSSSPSKDQKNSTMKGRYSLVGPMTPTTKRTKTMQGHHEEAKDDNEVKNDVKLGTVWLNFYDELKTYYEINGHCKVTCTENANLGRWCAAQRYQYKQYLNKGKNKPSKVIEKKKMLLDELGFVWKTHHEWGKRKSKGGSTEPTATATNETPRHSPRRRSPNKKLSQATAEIVEAPAEKEDASSSSSSDDDNSGSSSSSSSSSGSDDDESVVDNTNNDNRKNDDEGQFDDDINDNSGSELPAAANAMTVAVAASTSESTSEEDEQEGQDEVGNEVEGQQNEVEDAVAVVDVALAAAIGNNSNANNASGNDDGGDDAVMINDNNVMANQAVGGGSNGTSSSSSSIVVFPHATSAGLDNSTTIANGGSNNKRKRDCKDDIAKDTSSNAHDDETVQPAKKRIATTNTMAASNTALTTTTSTRSAPVASSSSTTTTTTSISLFDRIRNDILDIDEPNDEDVALYRIMNNPHNSKDNCNPLYQPIKDLIEQCNSKGFGRKKTKRKIFLIYGSLMSTP